MAARLYAALRGLLWLTAYLAKMHLLGYRMPRPPASPKSSTPAHPITPPRAPTPTAPPTPRRKHRYIDREMCLNMLADISRAFAPALTINTQPAADPATLQPAPIAPPASASNPCPSPRHPHPTRVTRRTPVSTPRAAPIRAPPHPLMRQKAGIPPTQTNALLVTVPERYRQHAIYLGQDSSGTQVLDQWAVKGGKPVGERTIYFQGHHDVVEEEINFMSWSRAPGLVGAVVYLTASTSVARVMSACPILLSRHGQQYWLNNASLFDHRPDHMGSLIPSSDEPVGHWDVGDGSLDLYLVCRYRYAASVVVFHVPGATSCTVSDHPYRAQCSTDRPAASK